MAVLSAPGPDGTPWAFVGPVLHYYERITQNFQRLTDEEWKTLYNTAPTYTPDLVNLYMADPGGQSRGSGPMLLTGVKQDPGHQVPGAYALYQNYPNPFNPSTFIGFTVPSASADQKVKLEIFDIQGRCVASLINAQLPHGNYTVRWDGLTLLRRPAASGIYFYRLSAGKFTQTMKMLLVR